MNEINNTSVNERKTTLTESKKRSSVITFFARLFRDKPLGAFGFVIVLILLLVGIFADVIAPYDVTQIDLFNTLKPPSGSHILGTDNLGRDILTNIIYGARISVIIGLSATILLTFISVIIGGSSAMIGGKFDLVVQRFVDGFMCIPGILILLILMSIIGKGMGQIIFAIGIPGGIVGSRLMRSAVIAIRENQYIEAARAIGATRLRLFIRHIIPNIMPVIIINFSTMIGGVILMEASLSFLGFGVPPGVPSWGSMLSREGRAYMQVAPWLALWPGIALSLVVYGINMFGDALRDMLDPRMAGGLVGSYRSKIGKKTKIKVKM